jgi:AcrR family transcriptional regulator
VVDKKGQEEDALTMGRPREFKLDEALDRALQVFRRNGYEGSSVAELTEAMGINPPSLYAAFGNKEALFRKALDRYAVRRTAHWDEALNEPSARRMIEVLLRETALFLTEECNPPGCLLVRSTVSCGETAEVIRKELASRRTAGEVAIRERLERAIADGELSGNVSPADFARYITTVLEGMAVQAAGGATCEEMLRVADMALRIWPLATTEVETADDGLAGLMGGADRLYSGGAASGGE